METCIYKAKNFSLYTIYCYSLFNEENYIKNKYYGLSYNVGLMTL